MQKQIMIERFNQQLEINKDFLQILAKADDICLQVAAEIMLVGEKVIDKDKIQAIIKEILIQLFKQELALIQKVSSRCKKLNKMLEMGNEEDDDEVMSLGVVYTKNKSSGIPLRMTKGNSLIS